MRTANKKATKTKRFAIAERAASFWFDIGTRVASALFFALAAGIYFHNAFAHLRNSAMAPSHLAWAADVASMFAIAFFMFIVAYIYAVRLRAISKFAGIVPMMAAIGGAFLNCGLLFLHPRTDLPVTAKIATALLILVGNSFAIWGLRYLGRSFSILPEGQKLVTGGPYRFVRHPLYVGEFFATLGAMINFLSPAAVALVVTQILLQFARIHYEEKVLRTTLPGYAVYAKRTSRLIPGIY